MSKLGSHTILKALSERHWEDFFMTEVKNGPTQWGTHLRMDAVAIKKSWANPCITAYEVKTSRNDFLRDDKWPGYLNYCNKFAFACPEGLIQPDELPSEVGLIWVTEEGKLKFKRYPVFRVVNIPAEFFQYIIMCKIQSDRYPFFCDKETYFKEYLECKREYKEIGRNLSYKIAAKIRDMEWQMTKLENQNNEAQEALKLRSGIERLLSKRCIPWDRWNGESIITAIERFIDTGKRGTDHQLRRIKSCAEEVLNYLKELDGSK